MNRYGTLLRMQLYNFFGINRMLHSGDKSEKTRILTFGFAGALIVAIFVAYSCLVCNGLAEMGFTDILPTIMVLTGGSITLVLTFMKSTGVLVGLRDYDMVMSLPVKSSAIVTSRITMIYLTNLAVSLIAGVPSIVIYGIYARPSIGIYLMLVISLLLTPIIPMIISLTVGVVISALSMRSKHNSLVTIVLSIAAMVGFMVLTMQSTGMTEVDITNLSVQIGDSVNRIYPPAAMLSSAIANNNPVQFLEFVALSLVCGVAFVSVVSYFYKTMNTAAFTHYAKGKYSDSAIKVSSPFFTMYKREFSRLISCAIYALNTSMGLVLMLALGFAILYFPADVINKYVDINMLAPAFPMVIATLVSMSSTTCVSLSLEGRHRFIILSSPVRPIDIFNAKIAMNLTMILPVSIITAILVSIALNASIWSIILMIIVPTAYAFFITVLGMYLNVKHPKYDWPSEYYAVKGGSVSLFGTMGFGLAASVIPLLVCMALPSLGWVVMLVAMLVVLFITRIIYRKLANYRLFAY